MTPNPDTPLKPCPFCSADVSRYDGDTIRHPDNDCLLSGDLIDEACWSRRAAIEAMPLNVLREALTELLALWDSYQESDLSQMNAHDCLVRYEVWNKARAVLERVGLS